MAYKMKGFSGFGNSPLKQKKEKKQKFEYSKEQELQGKPMPPIGSTTIEERHFAPHKLDPTTTIVKGKKKDVIIKKRGGGHETQLGLDEHKNITTGTTKKIIKKKRTRGKHKGKVKKEIEYSTTPSGKTIKHVTKYKKSGEIKKKKKPKVVKSKEKHKQHKKKHQKALSKVETTYTEGMPQLSAR